MSKYKATAVDGKVIFGDSIRWEILGCWMVHEGEQIPFVAVPNSKRGETLDVKTILEALRANAKKHE